MRRKVARIGPATLMVSLPSKWAKRYGLKKGDEIDIIESGKKLIINLENSKSFEKIQIDAKGLNDQVLKWTLAASHKAGYDEFSIDYNGKKTLSIIQEMVKEVLMGFVIVDQTDKKIVLRSVSQDISSEFDAALRRAFLVTLSIAENSLELIKNKKFTELQELITLEKTNNQLTNFCERILNKHGIMDDKLKTFWYVIVWNLEKVCDNYREICKLKFKPLNKELETYYKEVNSLLKDYYETFYNFNIEKLTNLEKRANNLESKGKKLISKNGELVYLTLSIIKDIKNFFTSTIALNQRAQTNF